jgi:hypothetical protein
MHGLPHQRAPRLSRPAWNRLGYANNAVHVIVIQVQNSTRGPHVVQQVQHSLPGTASYGDE